MKNLESRIKKRFDEHRIGFLFSRCETEEEKEKEQSEVG